MNESFIFFSPMDRSSVKVKSTISADFSRILFEISRKIAGFGATGVANEFSSTGQAAGSNMKSAEALA